MPTPATDAGSKITDPDAFLKKELELAYEGRKALSRYALARIVSERMKMPIKEAEAIVEAYCAEKAPATPAYLGSEFGIFWLKVVAIVVAMGGLGVFWYSAQMIRNHEPAFVPLALGTIICGSAVFLWVRSIEREFTP